jgi:opacity protein-like surface antigen
VRTFLILFLFATTLLRAEKDEKYFLVGVGLGLTTLSMDSRLDTFEESKNDSGTTVSWLLGYQIDKNFRFGFRFASISTLETDQIKPDLEYQTLSMDYIYPVENWNPFFGLEVARGDISLEIKNENNLLLEDETLGFGFRAGINYEINQNFEVGIGYDYLLIDLNSQGQIEKIENSYELELSQNNFSTLSLFLNYKFR